MARQRFWKTATRQGSPERHKTQARHARSPRDHGETRPPEVLGAEASPAAISVMGRPNLAPGVDVMGGPDRGPRLDLMGRPNLAPGVDVMGGPARGPRLDLMGRPNLAPGVDVMGGPDRGPRLDLMGHNDPDLEDALHRGRRARRLPGGQGPVRGARSRAGTLRRPA